MHNGRYLRTCRHSCRPRGRLDNVRAANNDLETVGAPKEDHAYRDLLFPRVIVSSAAIALGIVWVPENTIMVVAGCAAFMAANFYGVFTFLRGDLGR